jgi:hypothetical protein
MHWLRSHRFGAWCALFALAVQLVLSFGHVHRGATMRPLAHPYLAAAATDQAAAMPAGGGDLPTANFGFDYCGICTAVNLAGAGVLSATPPLPLPPLVSGVGHWERIVFASRSSRRIIFEARGPPQA